MGFSVAGSGEAGVRKKSPLAKPPSAPRRRSILTQSPQKSAGVVMMPAAAVQAAGSKKPSRKTGDTDL